MDHRIITGFKFNSVKDAWDFPTYSRRIGLYHIGRLDLEKFPQTYPGLDLVGKCFVAPRGQGLDCPQPPTDPVPKEYKVELAKYGQARSNELKATIWEKMQRLVRDLKEKEVSEIQEGRQPSSNWGSNYLWAHCLTLPGRYKNYFQ
jgi:hypothetical protein